MADNLTHTVVTVNNCGCFGFLNDFKICYGILDSCFNSVKINRLESVAAVAFNTALIRLKQNIRADFGILSRNAVADKCIRNKVRNQPPGAYYFSHSFVLHKNIYILNPPCQRGMSHRDRGIILIKSLHRRRRSPRYATLLSTMLTFPLIGESFFNKGGIIAILSFPVS